jgi:Flp pilus assembly protein TadD
MNDTTFKDLVELSDFYIISQKFEEALKVLNRAEKINKMDPKLYYNMGIAHEALNENDQARTAFRQALTLKPDYISAQQHLDRLIGE